MNLDRHILQSSKLEVLLCDKYILSFCKVKVYFAGVVFFFFLCFFFFFFEKGEVGCLFFFFFFFFFFTFLSCMRIN